jgi:uncharacterized protein YkwD
MRMKISWGSRRALSSEEHVAEPAPNSRGVVALLLAALVLVAAFVLVTPDLSTLMKDGSGLFSRFTSSLGGQIGANNGESLNYTIYSPLIANGSANITYPSDYGVLSTYALGLINSDRANYSLGAVTLSDIDAAQQHADSMLRYGYFSHNDTQGFKPYMRYTLLGGRGYVQENIATSYTNFPRFTSTTSVEGALKSLEYAMMHNDSQCCSNGHRYNILASLHNQVSIGVAFNSTRIFFVEDFENYYIALNFSVSDSYFVTMAGTLLKAGLSANSVDIAYDNTPSSETPAQLNEDPHEYGSGTPVGGVLPPCDFLCPTFEQGITVHADTWTFASNSVDVTFSLRDFIQRYGPGVYTVYLIAGTNGSSALTSISAFVG